MSFITNSFSQQTEAQPSEITPNIDYLKKSKKQKTAAWVLTGAGAVGLLGTVAADMSQVAGGVLITIITIGTVEPEYKSYTGHYLLSTALLGAGIGYFIASSKSKKKAIAVTSFKIQSIPLKLPAVNESLSHPAVTLHVAF
jgi:hypothetical protein